jgi:hypothetical protein
MLVGVSAKKLQSVKQERKSEGLGDLKVTLKALEEITLVDVTHISCVASKMDVRI